MIYGNIQKYNNIKSQISFLTNRFGVFLFQHGPAYKPYIVVYLELVAFYFSLIFYSLIICNMNLKFKMCMISADIPSFLCWQRLNSIRQWS